MSQAPQFDPTRSDAIRELLVETAASGNTTRRRRRRWLIAGSLAFGSVALAGSAAAWGVSHSGWVAMPSATAGASPSFAAVPHWPVNEHGETYGVQGDSPIPPDLIKASGRTAAGVEVDGYIRASDDAAAAQPPASANTPQKVLDWQAERETKYPHGIRIPLYKSDGTTQIGTFCIGNGC